MKLSYKLLSMIIAISLLLTGSILPITASALTDNNGSENQIALGDEMLKSEKLTLSDKAVLRAEDPEISEESMILKYIDSSQFNAAKHVQRLTELEDLNTYVFANADGTRSIYRMTIIHELGHALKLAHPKHADYIQDVPNGRGTYANDNSVCALMNQGDPNLTSNLTCATPKWHDIINLKNKWGE